MHLETVRLHVEEWSRWRKAPKPGRELGFPPTTQLGKILDGMPSTDCPTCRRSGKAYGGDCPTCSGSGKIKADPDTGKINPAFLRSTRQGSFQPDNPTCEKIDRLVCELRRDDYSVAQYYVITQEFCRFEYQKDRWKLRTNISPEYYEYLLNQALLFIGEGLESINVPRGTRQKSAYIGA